MRRRLTAALVAGVALLCTGLLATCGAHTQQHQQRQSLERDAERVAAAIGAAHLRSTPYVSSRTHTWVVAGAAAGPQSGDRPVTRPTEVPLAGLQEYVGTSSPHLHVAVVEREMGHVFLESGRPLPATDPPEDFPCLPADQLGAVGATPVTIDVGGRPMAASAVPRSPGDPNDWLVLEWTSESPGPLPMWLGLGTAGIGLAVVTAFVVALRRQQGRLHVAARIDHLTGLANRSAMEEALERAAQAARNPGNDEVAGVLVIDLDGFKQINDSLGHEVGDQVLREIGQRLRSSIHAHDTAARLGGDEFAVVLRRLGDIDRAVAVAHRLRETLIRPIEVHGRPRFVGASVGVAVFGEHGRTVSQLLRAADSAMYRAKRRKEGVRTYEAGTDEGSDALGLAAELLLALEDEDAIELAFQPEFSVATGAVVGVEVLARWRTASGPVPPSVFIPLAEDTGLIRPLTLLTLRKALDEARRWRDGGIGVPVSVNLSALILGDRSLTGEVRRMLAERNLDPCALVLEVTETALVGDADLAVAILGELRAAGIRVELDDFGSGYASFKALQELPLDGVKLDRALVQDGPGSGRQLLAATVDVGRRLGLRIVAEGIEDAATLAVVAELGVDTAQGFHLGRPTTAEAIRSLLGVAVAPVD